MITRVLAQVSKAVPLDKVVVVTSQNISDDPLTAYLGSIGISVYRGSLENVFARYQDCLEQFPCDWVARVTADSPLWNPSVYSFMKDTFKDGGAVDVVTNVFPRTFPNGQSVGSDKYAYKLDWLAACRDYLADQVQTHERFVVVGDFNIAPEPRDVHDAVAWAGEVLFSDAERAAFAAMIDQGLTDTFRLFEQEEGTFSWWDYRMGAFRRNRGLRIDHILASDALQQVCTACRIDRVPRTWEKPSDHAPVLAEFDL